MTILIKKRKNGHDYYYATKSGRVNGKPRVIWQKYLGRADEVVARLAGESNDEPDESICLDFGGPAALLAIAESFDLKGIIDAKIPKRDQGPSVGEFILLAAINRILAPTSKNQMGDWYQNTVLRRLWGFKEELFSAQNFWNHMDLIGEEEIRAVETELCKRVVERFKLDWTSLIYDTTNFFTFIDSTNDRCSLAQRGHSKAKRHDLRQVGLALVVARGSQIPLFHEVYQGNLNDITQFRSTCVALAERYKTLAPTGSDLTVVFDKGNNSEENLLLARLSNMHFVGSLKPSNHADLLAIPLSKFEELKDSRWPGLRTYRTRCDALGEERTVVITFSETFYSQQLNGWATQLAKATKQLEALSKDLCKEGSRRTKESIDCAARAIIQQQPLRDAIKFEITQTGKQYSLTYHTDLEIFQDYVNRRGGKTILATDHHDWSTSGIVAGYRSQAEIEQVFRTMKTDGHMDWQPMFHWTDSKIRVHGLYCVLGFFLLSVLKQRLSDAGHKLSFDNLLDALSSMQETEIVYHTGEQGRPATKTVYTRLNPLQKEISELLDLSRFKHKKK